VRVLNSAREASSHEKTHSAAGSHEKTHFSLNKVHLCSIIQILQKIKCRKNESHERGAHGQRIPAVCWCHPGTHLLPTKTRARSPLNLWHRSELARLRGKTIPEVAGLWWHLIDCHQPACVHGIGHVQAGGHSSRFDRANQGYVMSTLH
jgi:hypothetical protein